MQNQTDATPQGPSLPGLALLEQIGQIVAAEHKSGVSRGQAIRKAAEDIARRTTFVALFSAFCGWLILSPLVAMPFYNTLLFHPFPLAGVPKEIRGLRIQEVFFKSTNGSVLHALYVVNPHATKTVVLSHGNGGNVSYQTGIMQLVVDAGASVLAYDYQGFGRSTGKSSLDTVVDDAVAAYDFLNLQKGIAANNIVAVGCSLGSGVACQLSTKRHVASLILVSAYTDILRVGREKFSWLNLYPDLTFPRQLLNSANVLSKPHPKAMLIHGEHDPLISVEHARDLKRNSVGDVELCVIPQGDHINIYTTSEQTMIAKIKAML